jgi:hypothetical protein
MKHENVVDRRLTDWRVAEDGAEESRFTASQVPLFSTSDPKKSFA